MVASEESMLDPLKVWEGPLIDPCYRMEHLKQVQQLEEDSLVVHYYKSFFYIVTEESLWYYRRLKSLPMRLKRDSQHLKCSLQSYSELFTSGRRIENHYGASVIFCCTDVKKLLWLQARFRTKIGCNSLFIWSFNNRTVFADVSKIFSMCVMSPVLKQNGEPHRRSAVMKRQNLNAASSPGSRGNSLGKA